MKATDAKKNYEAIKSYISGMNMRVDDANVIKALNIISFCNTRIAECDKEIAEEAEEAKKAEEAKEEKAKEEAEAG